MSIVPDIDGQGAIKTVRALEAGKQRYPVV